MSVDDWKSPILRQNVTTRMYTFLPNRHLYNKTLIIHSLLTKTKRFSEKNIQGNQIAMTANEIENNIFQRSNSKVKPRANLPFCFSQQFIFFHLFFMMNISNDLQDFYCTQLKPIYYQQND